MGENHERTSITLDRAAQNQCPAADLEKEKDLVDICRTYDLKQSEVSQWIDAFLNAGKDSLKVNSKDGQAVHQKQIQQLQAKIGELVLEVEARKGWVAIQEDLDENPF